jgi:hypothetical protein
VTVILESYFDYVFSTYETMHSGVHINLITLDPQYHHLPSDLLNAIEDLEQYADRFISAYRALEWWSEDAPPYIKDTAKEILNRVTKPTRYFTVAGHWVEIE